MFEELKNQVCMITGGAGGIGRACAAKLGGLGMKIYITDIDAAAIDAALSALKEQGIECDGIVCDTSDPESTKAAVAACCAAFGTLDTLVHCAGIYNKRPFDEMTEKDWTDMINVNLNGCYHINHEAAAVMTEKHAGNIVNITSQAGIAGAANYAHYAASKAGIIGLTGSIALELADKGIRVNSIAPGFVRTRMTSNYPPERVKIQLEKIPLGRYAEPDEIAKIALFLVSDLSSYVTGVTMNASGGMLLHT